MSETETSSTSGTPVKWKKIGSGSTKVSILDAVENSPEKHYIITQMSGGVYQERAHKMMIRSGVAYLIDKFGSYPPPEAQLALAKYIIITFPKRKSKDGEGHELYYCAGSSAGFITNRLREVYRRYPPEMKKYKKRNTREKLFNLLPDDNLSDEQYKELKVRLTQLVPTDRNHHEVETLMAQTARRRREWIMDCKPGPTEILESFPRLKDTPGLIQEEFRALYPHNEKASMAAATFEASVAEKVLRFCKRAGKCLEINCLINLDDNRDPDQMTTSAMKCLVSLLPTHGKHRVAATQALQFFMEEMPAGTSLELALEDLKKKNRDLKRTQPYILLVKPSTYFVIVEDCALLVQPSTMSIALDTLMKCFYVFHTEYPKSLNVLYHFLQNYVYNLEGPQPTPRAQKLWTDISNVEV